MEFLKSVLGCKKFDEIEGEYVGKEFLISSLKKKIREYSWKCLGVLVRMGILN
jgi:hypothetical protein